ncbi:DUF4468 domain-containing protein [Flavobacterium artemisiae]|uniref:DUF4468 domain-containing protein n=1 Tax=Flavobacterium artemisiae TaxID=2126556 RepID=A0ABW4HGE1_9FLAO
MKQLVFLFFIIFVKFGFAQQTEFRFSEEGLTDFLVVECENKTQSQLYKKTIDWIAVTYNTPMAVQKAQIENEYIRIEGSAKDLLGSGTKYQIEISFKDGKYKFDITQIQFWNELDNFLLGGSEPIWKDFEMTHTNRYVDKKGQIKGRYKSTCEKVINYFNTLNLSLKVFLLSEQIPSKNKDW